MTKKLHQIRRQFRFTNDEFAKLEMAAELEHMPLAVWARQVLVETATKIEEARAEVSKTSSWSSYVKAKKILTERELQG
jgi:hypothetical protein